MFIPFGWPWSGQEGAPALEVLRREPAGENVRATPIVFVHGAFVGAWCWDEWFLPYFAGRGYRTLAPSLRAHGVSEGSLLTASLADYVADLRRVIAELDAPPVLVGHSMGGLVVQKYLESGEARAAVLMASVPPTGLVRSTLRLMLGDPLLFTQLAMMQQGGPGGVDMAVARRAVFSDHIPEPALQVYSRRMQPESQRALWDMTAGTVTRPWRVQGTPMLVLGAADDTLFSTLEVEATALAYGADLHVEPGMAHAMMLEPGWRSVAERIAAWLGEIGVH